MLSSLEPKNILHQAANGLAYLHQNSFIHRNVKPTNFMIKEISTLSTQRNYVIQITDLRLAKECDSFTPPQSSGTVASGGLEAPESQKKEEMKKSLDVFILECCFNYILTAMNSQHKEPKHPFCDQEEERVENIKNGKQIRKNPVSVYNRRRHRL